MQILALHGFTGCGGDFAPFAELVGEQWHCPDLPGHGPKPQLNCSPEASIDFIQEELSTFRSAPPTSKKVLLGYSMGARAALLHAIQYPDAWDALILISANPGIEHERERSHRRQADADLAAAIEKNGVAAFLEFWQQTPLIRSQQTIRADWRESMRRNRLKHQPQGLANSLRQFGQGSVPNLWAQLAKLKMPLCLITGESDTKYTEIAQRMLPMLHSQQSIHKVIEGASHMPQLERPQATANLIREVFRSAQH